MTETRKFDDQKLLFSAVIEAGGERCSFMLGIEGIGIGELSPITREGTLEDTAILIKEMSEELRRGFATYIVEKAALKKKKPKTSRRSSPPQARKEEPAETKRPAEDVEAEDAGPAGEEAQDGQNSFWDAF